MEFHINFETLVDVRGDAFADYWSGIIGKLRRSSPAYRDMEKEIETLYAKFPRVQAVLDGDMTSELTKEECGALNEILSLQSRLTVMQQEAIYLRGCYDEVDYLKKAGIL